MDFQFLLRSKIVTVLLVVVFCAVAFIATELYMQKRQVDHEVARLNAQSENLKKDNKDLSELIKYLDTPEFKEKEAREKLNLKRPGEEVVVLPQDEITGQVASANTNSGSHPEKWLKYFFKPNAN